MEQQPEQPEQPEQHRQEHQERQQERQKRQERALSLMNTYFKEGHINAEDLPLLKEEINYNTVSSYVPRELLPEFLAKLRNLKLGQLNMSESVLVHAETFGLVLFKHPHIRCGKLQFNSIPASMFNRYFMHTTRPHPLREAVIGGPPMTLQGAEFDLDLAKKLAWTDTDTDDYSGILVYLVLAENKKYIGCIAPINNTQQEYKLFFADAGPPTEADYAMDICYIRSLLIKEGNEIIHEHLIKYGILYGLGNS